MINEGNQKLSKGSSLTVCLSENEELAPRIAKLLSFIIMSLQIPPSNIQAHNKWYQSRVPATVNRVPAIPVTINRIPVTLNQIPATNRVPATMAEGTRLSELVDAMVTLREDNAFDDPLGALMNLRQTSIVKKYRSQFEVLFEVISIGILKHSTSEFWVNKFISRLNEEIRKILTILKPISLQVYIKRRY
jgi:hypothetical protein